MEGYMEDSKEEKGRKNYNYNLKSIKLKIRPYVKNLSS